MTVARPGSQSQWFRNLLADPRVTVRAGRSRQTFISSPIRNRRVAQKTAGKFRAKYGRDDVAQYYSRFDAAIEIPLAAEMKKPA